MENVEKGMVAWSRAGHDAGRMYIITEMDEHYAYLADGKSKTLERPKRKKWKHIQIMKQVPEELQGSDWSCIKNEDIKHAIKIMSKEKNQEV